MVRRSAAASPPAGSRHHSVRSPTRAMVSLSSFSSRRIRFASSGVWCRRNAAHRSPFSAGSAALMAIFSGSIRAKVSDTHALAPLENTRRTSSGCPDRSSFVSSAAIRSLLTWTRFGARARIAASVPSSIENPSWAANRSARRILSASSLNRSSGRPTQRIRPAFRSSWPPNASTRPLSLLYAMAFIVKSRRFRSSLRSGVNSTVLGWRPSSYSPSIR